MSMVPVVVIIDDGDDYNDDDMSGYQKDIHFIASRNPDTLYILYI